ncbi:MAG TPA: nitroreductase family protein [Acidimicrobiales bacterium]|nr:nitroreductase family protein [Acidimicrobiales bacterium]
MPDFFDVVLAQRAYRELKPDAVPDELVLRVLEAATHAPSAENHQPWEFIVVRDAATRAAIGRLTQEVWDAGGREYSRRGLSPRFFEAVDRWATGGLAAAPVHVVVCGDTERTPEAQLPSSIYPAVQNLLLAAGALGLGSLMSTLSVGNRAALAEVLALPGHIVPMALVPLGWPVRELGPARREPVASHLHRDRWGT